jgi:hypothetical protein
VTLTITLPLDSEQATAVVVAADRFGVEPWEIAVHILALRQELDFAA